MAGMTVPDLSIGSVQAEPLAGRAIPRLPDGVSADAFGESLGQAIDHSAEALQQHQQKVQLDADRTRVTDAKATLESGIVDLTHNPQTGALTKQGSDAISLGPQYLPQYDAQVSKIREGLTGKRQLQAFDQIAAERRSALTQTLDTHEYQQTQVYQNEVDKRGIASAQTLASSNYTSPDALQQARSDIVDIAHNSAERTGVHYSDPEGKKFIDQTVAQNLAGMHEQVLHSMLADGRIEQADQYWNANRGELGNQALPIRNMIDSQMHQKTATGDALKLALDVKGQTTDIGQQERILDQRFKAGDINADVHDMALQKLRADNAQRRSEQTESDRYFMGQIFDLKQKNPNVSITDLSPSQQSYMKARGLGPHVTALLKEGPVVDDSKLFNDQMRMSAEDPSGFAKQDMSIYRGQLTQPHWDHLVGLQTSVNRQDIAAMDQAKVLHNTVTDIKSGMAAAGLDLNPKPGAKADALNQFEASLRDSLIAAQNTKKAPLSRDEARQIGLGLLKDQTLSGTGFLFDTHKPVWQMTPEERAKSWTIPDDDRKQITEALTKRNQPVTEDAIQRLYKYAQGVR